MQPGTNDQVNEAFLKFNSDFNQIFRKAIAATTREQDGSQSLHALWGPAARRPDRDRRD